MTTATGNATMAPNLLVRLISLAVREVPGVARLGSAPNSRRGVVAQTSAEGVSADCYVIAQVDTNLLELGVAIQATVAAVLQELAGMTAREVNVYVQDVEAGSG